MSSVPSYRHLAAAYDQLFPLDPQALAFVVDSLGTIEGKAIVDAGCGTGLLAQALGERGARVFAFDIDGDLLSYAWGRSSSTVWFSQGDLRVWDLPAGFPKADAVVCFGNTLPHLILGADLDEFFVRTARALSPKGKVLVQVLDYEFLARSRNLELPRRVVGDWVFSRRYEVQTSGLWTFHTELSWPGGQSSNSFELCPWRRSDLESALARAGFVVEGVFGGFDGCPAGISLPLVLKARLA